MRLKLTTQHACCNWPINDSSSASCCLRRGRGCQLTKLDVEAAYRIVPVHPDDHPLLGLCWDGQVFLDTTLPFGLCSAPKILNTVVDGLHWVLEQEGLEVLHNLDDFLLFEAPEELTKGSQHRIRNVPGTRHWLYVQS